MTTRAQPILGPAQHTPEWLVKHAAPNVTGTDIATILDRNPHKSACGLFMEKTGRVPAFEGNAFTRRGLAFQRAILDDYTEQTGVAVADEPPMWFHPAMPFFGVSPDAIRVLDQNLVEAKLTMSPVRAQQLGEEGTDQLPDDWILQGQSQLSVMGVEFVDFAVLLFGRTRIYNVPRNEDLVQIVESSAQEFHERLVNDDCPEPKWEHPQTPTLINALYGVREALSVPLSEGTELDWAGYQDLGRKIKTLEADRESLKARVLYAMGEAGIGELSDGRQLVRSTVNRKEYVCKASSFVTIRERKSK